jgi:hypothetical protein
MPINAYLEAVLANDADIAVLHLKFIADENLRHP